MMKIKEFIFGERDRDTDEIDDAPIWRIRVPLNNYADHFAFAEKSVFSEAIDLYGEDNVRDRLPDDLDDADIRLVGANKFFVPLGFSQFEANVDFGDKGYTCSVWTPTDAYKNSPLTYEAIKFALGEV